MKKKICLIMCLALIVTAFASVTFARKEQCSYCGATMKPYHTTAKYVIRTYSDTCKKYSNKEDMMKLWGRDTFYVCSSPTCGIETYDETETYVERICSH